MLHLVSIRGKSAQDLYLDQRVIPDFKAALRTIVAGRILIVSTRFRSDLVYSSEGSKTESIIKLWSFYANLEVGHIKTQDLIIASGNKGSLTTYFQSLHELASNWHQYLLYKKAFHKALQNDQNNPITMQVLDCEKHVLKHPHINRTPLVPFDLNMEPFIFRNTDRLAKTMINNDLHLN